MWSVLYVPYCVFLVVYFFVLLNIAFYEISFGPAYKAKHIKEPVSKPT